MCVHVCVHVCRCVCAYDCMCVCVCVCVCVYVLTPRAARGAQKSSHKKAATNPRPSPPFPTFTSPVSARSTELGQIFGVKHRQKPPPSAQDRVLCAGRGLQRKVQHPKSDLARFLKNFSTPAVSLWVAVPIERARQTKTWIRDENTFWAHPGYESFLIKKA